MENEKLYFVDYLVLIIDVYWEMGFVIVIDDFGVGYFWFNFFIVSFLSIFKLDMGFIRDVYDDVNK